MAYQMVVGILGENLASLLELAKKWLVEWKVDCKKLLIVLNNTSKISLAGLLDGTHQICEVNHVIDLDAKPYKLGGKGLFVKEHKLGGKFAWDPSRIKLFQSEKNVYCASNLKQLEGRMVLNANLLDYLLDRPHIIPNNWKGKKIHFPGTIYPYPNNPNIYVVRCLFWSGRHWYETVHGLESFCDRTDFFCYLETAVS